MSSTVKSLKVTYNPINDSDTFTSGDSVSGQVTLEVAKDCEVESLMVKFKGKASVLWTERHGQVTVVYSSKDKYFSIKHYFIQDKNHPITKDDDQVQLTTQSAETYSNVLAPGVHIYPFTLQIPFKEMPSSFKSSTGKIVYSLQARLSRSLRIDKKDTTKINFVSNVDLSGDPQLMVPQHETKDKKMKYFNSGTVAMDVDIEKTGFRQGEGIKVIACIQNNSSRPIKPKYCLYSKHSFFARGKRRLHTNDLLKEVGEPIPPSASEKVTRVITIPHDLEPSIHNCSILKAEHRLRVSIYDDQVQLTTQSAETYSNVLAPGVHIYPFTLQIPFKEMPSSFKSSTGKIVYSLQARLSRSLRIDKKDTTKINFVSNVDLSGDPQLMVPQHETKDKKMKYFNSGTVAMDVDIEKTGFRQGEGIKVIACIQNNSSRPIKPKYCLYSKHSFFARGKRRLHTNDLLKEVGEPIPPSASEKVTRVITIPHDLEPSIHNCSILKAEHRLRVYLDVKYASDPEIKFPIIVLPAAQVAVSAPPLAASGFGFEPSGNTNSPWGAVPPPAAPQPLDPPPPYGAYGMYPTMTDFGNTF